MVKLETLKSELSVACVGSRKAVPWSDNAFVQSSQRVHTSGVYFSGWKKHCACHAENWKGV